MVPLIQDYCLAVLRSGYNEKHVRLTASHDLNSQKKQRAAAVTRGPRPVRAEPKASLSRESKARASFRISCCLSITFFFFLISASSPLTKNESTEVMTLLSFLPGRSRKRWGWEKGTVLEAAVGLGSRTGARAAAAGSERQCSALALLWRGNSSRPAEVSPSCLRNKEW